MKQLIRKFTSRALRTFIVGVKNGFQRYCIFFKKFGYLSPTAKIAVPIHISTPKNVFIDEYASIGPHSTILTTNAKFILKKQSVAAGNLSVVTGNHVRIIGRYLLSIKENEKPCGFDKDVIVYEDVWIGLNVTILAGVVIGRGATIAAGAVVVNSIPPYCIAGGVPAKVLKFYWTIDEILQHEEILYTESERYTREELENFMNLVH